MPSVVKAPPQFFFSFFCAIADPTFLMRDGNFLFRFIRDVSLFETY